MAQSLTNKQYEVILFDLDGTITDSGLGITNSVAYALSKYHIYEADRTKLYPFIGPPLEDSFEKIYGFSKEQAREAICYYREYYEEKGMLENQVYEGVEELLVYLKGKGKKIMLATSKPEVYAKKILLHFELAQYFDYIAGATFDGTRSEKHEVITHILENNPTLEKEKVLMVGDREHDTLGAYKVGIDSLGVLYGFGNRKELEEGKATYIVEEINEIRNYI